MDNIKNAWTIWLRVIKKEKKDIYPPWTEH